VWGQWALISKLNTAVIPLLLNLRFSRSKLAAARHGKTTDLSHEGWDRQDCFPLVVGFGGGLDFLFGVAGLALAEAPL
jgi:hypothetical protein